MKGHEIPTFRLVLPLPAFVLHPLTALVIATLHVYLAAGHLSKLIGGELQWTHFWKGFGALAGVYVFAALGSRGLARHAGHHISLDQSGIGNSTFPLVGAAKAPNHRRDTPAHTVRIKSKPAS